MFFIFAYSTMSSLKFLNHWSTIMMFVRQFYCGNRFDLILSISVVAFSRENVLKDSECSTVT